MQRHHLFEWEDFAWLPRVFRDYTTDHLRHRLASSKRLLPVNRLMARRIKALLLATGSVRIVDLCAGAGGPLPEIQRLLASELRTPVPVLLTDLFPNTAAFAQLAAGSGGMITAHQGPVNVFAVPAELTGLRTLFTALHHFKPDQVQQLLADAAASRQPIAIFEPLERTPRMLLLAGLDTLYRCFFLTPFVARPGLLRLLLTYVLPIAPALAVWDAMVSVLRAYTPTELRMLAAGIGGASYRWEAGQFDLPGPLATSLPTVFLLGWPVPAAPAHR